MIGGNKGAKKASNMLAMLAGLGIGLPSSEKKVKKSGTSASDLEKLKAAQAKRERKAAARELQAKRTAEGQSK